MNNMKALIDDLAQEQQALDIVVAGIEEPVFKAITPFSGWSIHDEISHLAFFDRAARLALTDAEAFGLDFQQLAEGIATSTELHDRALQPGRNKSPQQLVEWWRQERASLVKALGPLQPKARVPWYGPSMSARSMATARIMETWAHGQDIVDTVGADRPATDRLKHIAHLGYVTFGWSFTTNNLQVPDIEVRLELQSPSHELWTWGPQGAENVLRGSAEEFCLVAVRRRHFLDTSLEISGQVARQWISIAQAFAGPPEPCPPAGRFKEPHE